MSKENQKEEFTYDAEVTMQTWQNLPEQEDLMEAFQEFKGTPSSDSEPETKSQSDSVKETDAGRSDHEDVQENESVWEEFPAEGLPDVSKQIREAIDETWSTFQAFAPFPKPVQFLYEEQAPKAEKGMSMIIRNEEDHLECIVYEDKAREVIKANGIEGLQYMLSQALRTIFQQLASQLLKTQNERIAPRADYTEWTNQYKSRIKTPKGIRQTIIPGNQLDAQAFALLMVQVMHPELNLRDFALPPHNRISTHLKAVEYLTTRDKFFVWLQKNPGMKEVLLPHFYSENDKLKSASEVLAMDDVSSPKKQVVKVGRNDPCPCGSGKKYKNCCGKKK